MADHRSSPLHRLAGELADASAVPEVIRLAERPFETQLALRAAPDEAAAVAAVLGAELPGPNRAVRGCRADVLWLGPDEWLLVGGDQALEGELRAHATVVDVSAQRAVLELSGAAARDVLRKGCSLDLHPRVFGPGQCAQSALGRAGVILLARGEDAFWVFVRASFAEYLAEWLLDATAEDRAAAPALAAVAA